MAVSTASAASAAPDGMYSIDGGDRFGETRLQRKASAAYAGARASG
jgi:hypothetical protein